MSQERQDAEPHHDGMTLDALARACGAEPVASPDELVGDLWDSDSEFEDFLADVRAARNRSLA